MHLQLANRHTDEKSTSKNQSCKWDAGLKEVDNPTAADPWIQPPSRCYFHCIRAEFGRWADSSTKEMVRSDKAQVQFLTPMCAALMVQLTPEQMWTIHRQCEHPVIRHTTYFCHRICPSATKAIVRSIIQYKLVRNANRSAQLWPSGKREELKWETTGIGLVWT